MSQRGRTIGRVGTRANRYPVAASVRLVMSGFPCRRLIRSELFSGRELHYPHRRELSLLVFRQLYEEAAQLLTVSNRLLAGRYRIVRVEFEVRS